MEQRVFFIALPDETGGRRHHVLNLSTHLFIPLLANLWTWYFEHQRTDSDTNWHKWSTG